MLWNIWKKQVEKTTHQEDQTSMIIPETKEKITRQAIVNHLNNVDDAVIKDITINRETVTILFVQSLVEDDLLQELVFEPLYISLGAAPPEQILPLAEVIQENELPKLMLSLMSGYCIILFPDRELILRVNTFKVPHRSIGSSETESTVLGPQDSFVESLQSNLSLIRRRLITPHLKIRNIMLGTETNNSVAVLYLENIANAENVERVIYRIKNVEFHGFTGTAILRQMLEDMPYSPFPQLGLTTRPDNAVASLLDGRILVLLNGSPDAAICPASFFEMFVSPDDFYNNWAVASVLRFIRFFGLFVTIFLSSTYVSVVTYHQEMLPPPLLTMLSESRSKVPFPPVVEVLIMELTIEVLREAGVRMPTKIGQTIGIVGGIVIGTAAVQAGLASNILIVVVSISALLSFLPPNFLMSNAIRLLRYVFILMAGYLGIFGQMISLAFMFAHLAHLTSLGSPYLSTGILSSWTDIVNSLLRAPMSFLLTRSGLARAKKQLVRPLDEE